MASVKTLKESMADIEARIEELEEFFDGIPESDGKEANYPEFRELSDLYTARAANR